MLNKEKKTLKLNLNLDTNRRMIFMSDIHGRYDLFDKAICDLNFSVDDYIFIIGDIIEKNDNNLKMIDDMISFQKNHSNVYFISGNCDEIFRQLIPPVKNDIIYKYASNRGHSIINDIARYLNYNITVDTDFSKIFSEFIDKKSYYFEFLDSFSDIIIINGKITLVHGGIDDIDNIPFYPKNLHKNDAFYFKNNGCKIWTIVGHYPTINYSKEVASLNPIIDYNKKIISIDGGIGVILGGQLNVLILDNLLDMNYSYKAYDDFLDITINNDVLVENKTSLNLQYGRYPLKVVKDIGDYYQVILDEFVNYDYIIPKFLIKTNEQDYYCCEGFTTFFPFLKGDKVKLVYQGDPYYIVKYDGKLYYLDSKYV